MKTLFDAIVKNIPIVLKSAGEIVGSLVGAFAKLLPKIVGIGVDIVKGVWQGIKSMASTFANNIKNFFSGIVDSVKSVLGIHSPSRVFAGIGENMALGLGEGWESEYGTIKRGITNGLDFGTATVGFADSGIGRSSAAIVNSMGVSTETGTTTINLMFPDGTKLASYLLPFSIKAAAAAGTPIANAQMA